MQTLNKNEGLITQIIGPVIDVEFQQGELPEIYNALNITMDDGTVVVNATTCNLAAMKQVKELLDEEGQKVVIIHFFFQLTYLQKYFGNGDNVEYCLFSYTDMFGE